MTGLCDPGAPGEGRGQGGWGGGLQLEPAVTLALSAPSKNLSGSFPADSEEQTQHALYIFKAPFQQKGKEMEFPKEKTEKKEQE